MATKKVDVSSNRITYGFPGAECANFFEALGKAEKMFKEAQKKYGDKLIEGWDRAIQKEDTSLWLSMHIKVAS